MSDKHTPGRLYIRTNRHPNTDGTPWGWVDLHEPGSMLQASPDGIRVTWSRGQKSEANARRLVACWNWCEGQDTDGLELSTKIGRTAKDFITEAYAKELELIAQRDDLLEALKFILKWGHCQEADDKARAAIAKAEAK